MEYRHEFGSIFPDRVNSQGEPYLEYQKFKDVDESVIDKINRIKKYMNEGDFKNADLIMRPLDDDGVPHLDPMLKPYLLTCDFLNLLEEELMNLQIYALNNTTPSAYEPGEPSNPSAGTIWVE